MKGGGEKRGERAKKDKALRGRRDSETRRKARSVTNGRAPIGALVLDPRVLLSSNGAPPRSTRRFSGFCFVYFLSLVTCLLAKGFLQDNSIATAFTRHFT